MVSDYYLKSLPTRQAVGRQPTTMAGGGSLPECAGYGRGRQPTRVCRLWQGEAAYQSVQAMAGGEAAYQSVQAMAGGEAAYQSVQAMAGGGSLPECAGYGRGRQPTRVYRLWQGEAAYQSVQAMAGGEAAYQSVQAMAGGEAAYQSVQAMVGGGSLPECAGYGRGGGSLPECEVTETTLVHVAGSDSRAYLWEYHALRFVVKEKKQQQGIGPYYRWALIRSGLSYRCTSCRGGTSTSRARVN